MHNAEAAIEPAFYDHEDDNVRERERVAADWGADEVFATVPRRRFRGERLSVAAAHAAPAHVRRAATYDLPADPAPRAAAEPAEPAELVTPEPPSAPAITPTGLTDGVSLDAPRAWTDAPAEPGGRRTVTITGRPEGTPPPPRPIAADRRRPPRTVTERIGGRPDRLAGWAFGMGLLLIAIAAASADAAPL